MSRETPDAKDAELVLRLYELRREAVMRQSRDAMNSRFFPAAAGELLAVTPGDHPLNAAFRQVSTYWEMAYGMGRHGIVHPEYLVENCGEGLFLFAKVQPWLEPLRAETSPRAFLSAEWAATRTDIGRRYVQMFQSRLKARAASSS